MAPGRLLQPCPDLPARALSAVVLWMVRFPAAGTPIHPSHHAPSPTATMASNPSHKKAPGGASAPLPKSGQVPIPSSALPVLQEEYGPHAILDGRIKVGPAAVLLWMRGWADMSTAIDERGHRGSGMGWEVKGEVRRQQQGVQGAPQHSLDAPNQACVAAAGGRSLRASCVRACDRLQHSGRCRCSAAPAAVIGAT